MQTGTYNLLGGKNVRDGCILQVADAPSNIKAVVGKVFTAEVLMSTRAPAIPLHIIHPLLKPRLIVKRKPFTTVNSLLH